MHTTSIVECWGRQSVFPITALGVSRVICVPSCVPQVPAPPLHYPQGSMATPPNPPAACPMTPGSQDLPFSTPEWSSATFLISKALHPCLEQHLSWVFGVYENWPKSEMYYKCFVLKTGWYVPEQATLWVKLSVFSPKSTRKACFFWVMLFLHRMLWN